MDSLFIFGGGNSKEMLNDIWMFDTLIMKWSQLDNRGVVPTPRAGYGLVSVSTDEFIIYGGGDAESVFE